MSTRTVARASIALVVLVSRYLWKERNAWVFNQVSRLADELISFIVAEGWVWAAGFTDFLP
jgi:hypothetical protein